MTRTMRIGVIFALGPALASPAIGQDSATRAPNERNAARQVERQPAEPEFKVAFWYLRANPSASLHTQAYDLRRGEYDRASVEGWLRRMRTEFPAYVAFERDVDLDAEPGPTEDVKLAAAIKREREQILRAHARRLEHRPVPPNQPNETAGREVSRPLDLSNLLHPGGAGSMRSFTGGGLGSGTFRGSPGSGGYSRPPSSPLFPTPYPYSRPHP